MTAHVLWPACRHLPPHTTLNVRFVEESLTFPRQLRNYDTGNSARRRGAAAAAGGESDKLMIDVLGNKKRSRENPSK